MAKLVDAEFVRFDPATGGWATGGDVSSADGVYFLCPLCAGHGVLCWFAGRVPDDVEPRPGRWTPSGSSIDDLTLMPSVFLQGGCGWHGFVVSGEATAC